jgi:hypothetical protein
MSALSRKGLRQNPPEHGWHDRRHARGQLGRRSVERPPGCGVGELGDGRHYPPPRRRPIIMAGERELIGSGGSFFECLLAVALEHQLRRSPNLDLGYHSETMYARHR